MGTVVSPQTVLLKAVVCGRMRVPLFIGDGLLSSSYCIWKVNYSLY